MRLDDLMAAAREVVTVRQVFGEPVERDGVTVIPVANVMGGGGGGEGGQGDEGSGSGAGGGFGFRATPAGVYVIDQGQLRWEPALDLNRVILTSQVTAVLVLLVVRSIVRSVRNRD